MSADWEMLMATIVQSSDAELLRKVRDMFVKGHHEQNTTRQTYYCAALSEMADRLEAQQARNARLSVKLKDLVRRIKAGELDEQNS
jgi:hypothetical protein